MIEIDGSQGEGGGQILRTSLAMSILTGQPVQITNIRANRKVPGLAPQHLAGVLAAAEICKAEVTGAKLRSTYLTFIPGGAARPGSYQFDISRMADQGSAGAVTLVLQTILLPLATAEGPTQLVLDGGTHVAWSPPVHYVEWVLLPTLAQMGLSAKLNLVTYGWYPVGGGKVEVAIAGNVGLKGIDLTERGDFQTVQGLAVVSNLTSHIPQRMADRANSLLREGGLPAGVKSLRTRGPSTGAGLFLTANYSNVQAGFGSLGEKGKASEQVAEEAVKELIAYTVQPYALDPHLPDQLLPAMALAEGSSALSTMEITRHTLTNIEIIQRFVERKILVEGKEGKPGVIRVE